MHDKAAELTASTNTGSGSYSEKFKLHDKAAELTVFTNTGSYSEKILLYFSPDTFEASAILPS